MNIKIENYNFTNILDHTCNNSCSKNEKKNWKN